MRLQSIRIDGYKRFGDPATLRVRGRTVAVLGHNESGKSSLLSAIAHVGRNGFAAAAEFTDRTPRSAAARILSARFAIEQSDIDAVRDALKDRFVQGQMEPGEHCTCTSGLAANGGTSWSNSSPGIPDRETT